MGVKKVLNRFAIERLFGLIMTHQQARRFFSILGPGRSSLGCAGAAATYFRIGHAGSGVCGQW